MKDYCPFVHIEDCRKAFKKLNEGINDGQGKDEEILKKIVTQNACTTEDALYRWDIYKKYPKFPNEDTIKFIHQQLANPKWDKKANEIALEERKKYKME